jgi:hypothetical protein
MQGKGVDALVPPETGGVNWIDKAYKALIR